MLSQTSVTVADLARKYEDKYREAMAAMRVSAVPIDINPFCADGYPKHLLHYMCH